MKLSNSKVRVTAGRIFILCITFFCTFYSFFTIIKVQGGWIKNHPLFLLEPVVFLIATIAFFPYYEQLIRKIYPNYRFNHKNKHFFFILRLQSILNLLIIGIDIILYEYDILTISNEVIGILLFLAGTLILLFIFIFYNVKYKESSSVIIRAVKLVFLTQIIVAASFVIAEYRYEISGLRHYLFPLAVSEMQIRVWEQKAKEKYDRSDIIEEIESVPNFKMRVDLARIACSFLQAGYTECNGFLTDGKIPDGSIWTNFWSFLHYFDLFHIKASRYKKSRFNNYLPEEKLLEILNTYLRQSLVDNDLWLAIKISTFLNQFNRSYPEQLLVSADSLMEYSGDLCDAREKYQQFVSACSLSKSNALISEHVERIINTRQLTILDEPGELFKIWFQDLFNRNIYSQKCEEDTFKVKWLGSFHTSLYSLINWNDFNKYISLFLPDCKRTFRKWEPLERLAACKISKHFTSDFIHVNPAFISWVCNNMIPDPQTEVGSVTLQYIYNQSFRDMVRAYAFCYLFLNKQHTTLEKWARQYSSIYIDSATIPITSWLHTNFGNFVMLNNSVEQIWYPRIAGFWLRRYLDGSISELWSSLICLLEKYDPLFYASVIRSNSVDHICVFVNAMKLDNTLKNYWQEVGIKDQEMKPMGDFLENFYTKQLADTSYSDYSALYREIDLDSDGRSNEIIIRYKGCDDETCTTWILSKSGTTYTVLFQSKGAHLFLSRKKHHGYNDILFIEAPRYFIERQHLWRYDGNRYAEITDIF